jgi:hypothetical protein
LHFFGFDRYSPELHAFHAVRDRTGDQQQTDGDTTGRVIGRLSAERVTPRFPLRG